MSLFECDEGTDDHDSDNADPGVEDEDGQGRIMSWLFRYRLVTGEGLTVGQGWNQNQYHSFRFKI